MQSYRYMALRGLLASGAMFAAGIACAQQAPDMAQVELDPAQAGWLVVIEPADLPAVDTALGASVDPSALADLRGGTQIVDNEVLVNGRVEDAIAADVMTGNNNLTGGSFANASGISTVIQNTGANVLIQNAMIVNVKFSDAGP